MNAPRSIILSLAILGTTIVVSPAQAQRGIPLAAARAGRSGTAASRAGGLRSGSVPLRRLRQGFAGQGFAGQGFVPYYDYNSEPETIEVPPSQVIVEQSPQPASPSPAPNPVEPLVLELQGDHWVRITNYGESQTGAQSTQPEPPPASSLPSLPSTAPPANPRRVQTAQPAKLPATVLVFRDGHQEEAQRYMIQGNALYVRLDYWTAGSWTKKVPIDDLDIPATLKVNMDRGGKFNLPSGPSEIVVRF